jgi:hypothetical protein
MKLDLKKLKLREVNEKLQSLDRKQNDIDFTIVNPEGNHALCAGVNRRNENKYKRTCGLLLCRNESESSDYY